MFSAGLIFWSPVKRNILWARNPVLFRVKEQNQLEIDVHFEKFKNLWARSQVWNQFVVWKFYGHETQYYFE